MASKMQNAKKVLDFQLVLEQYEELWKQEAACHRASAPVPDVFYKTIDTLEQWVSEQQAGKKDMKKAKAMQLTKLTSKCRKQNGEIRELIEEKKTLFREDQNGSSAEDGSSNSENENEDESGSESDDESSDSEGDSSGIGKFD